MTGPGNRCFEHSARGHRRTWRTIDGRGNLLATGPTPAAALSATAVPSWPLSVESEDGRRLTFADAVGAGGLRVQSLLSAPGGAIAGDVETLVRTTPAGFIDLPVERVALAAGVAAAGRVDPLWLARVDDRRAESRAAVAGRAEEVEAALHVTLLLAADRFDPDDDTDVDAHVASGARLWLMAGAVVSALSGADPDPFEAWGRLVACGWWPVGPSGGRLVLSASQ